MKGWLRHAIYAVASVVMTLGLLAQFSSAGLGTHYVLILSVFAVCWIMLRFCAARISRRDTVAALLWGAGLSLAYLLGAACKVEQGVLPAVHFAQLIVRFAGMALFFGGALGCLLGWPPRHVEPELLTKAQSRRWFFIAWGVIALCWLPYWLTLYPCVVSGDTMTQYHQVLTGEFSNHHPIVHTLSLGASTWIAGLVGGSETQGFAGYALAQLIGLSAVLAWVVVSIRQRLRGVWVTLLALAYCALNPIHAVYAITLWKDIPFSALATLMVLILLRAAETRGETLRSRGAFIGLIVVWLGLLFMRTNGIAVVLCAAVALIAFCAPIRKRLCIATATLLAVYLLVQGPVFSALGLAQPSATETLSIPMQQVAMVAHKQLPLTEQETQAIERVMPIDEMRRLHDPIRIDNIKFSPLFQSQALRDHPGEYARLWVQLGFRYPAAYLEAYNLQTYRYWYADQVVYFGIAPNYSGHAWTEFIKTKPLTSTFSFLQNVDIATWSIRLPMLSLVFSQGLQIWYVLAAMACLWARRKSRYILALLPLLAIWTQLMLATPYAETRYIYALYCCMPLSLALIGVAKLEKPRTNLD